MLKKIISLFKKNKNAYKEFEILDKYIDDLWKLYKNCDDMIAHDEQNQEQFKMHYFALLKSAMNTIEQSVYRINELRVTLTENSIDERLLKHFIKVAIKKSQFKAYYQKIKFKE